MGAGCAAPRRGAHRYRKRPRRALPGMMLHQDGSSHEWVPGRWWDLIVTMDDATSDIYSAFFVAEEGTMSSFQGVPCSLYADRASHYWNTPEAGGKVDKDTPTQVDWPASRPRPRRGTAFVPFTGALDDILCIHEERTVGRTR